MSTEPKTVERRIRFRKFTSETGKILPRRVTGLSAKMHRKVTREIKRARSINLLP